LLLCAGALLAPAAPSQGQQGGVRLQVRAALTAADDSYKRGDYEAAQFLLGEAKALAGELSQVELQQLADLTRRNIQALNERKGAIAQLLQAEDALNKGRREEAGALIQALNVNPYLGPTEKQHLADLTARLGNGSPAGAPPPAIKEDARALTDAARTALQRGDLDRAEVLARQAEAVASSWPAWLQPPWRDTPSRVLRDVQAARKKQADDLAARNNPRPPDKQESGSGLMAPLQTVKNLFSRGPATKEQPGPQLPADAARAEATPGQPAADGRVITVAAAAAAGAGNGQVIQSTQYRPGQGPVPTPEIAQAEELLRMGRAALAQNDLAAARRFAEQALAVHAALPWWDDTPEKLLADIRARTNPVAPNPPPAGGQGAPPTTSPYAPATVQVNHDPAGTRNGPPADPRALVRQARELLRQDKLDEADRLSLQAAAVPKTRWGLFEDSPEKLRIAIQQARAAKDKDEAARLLVEAQQSFDRGDLKQAKSLAYQAKRLHGPYSVWDRGDRPDRLLAAIQAAEAREARKGKPPQTDGVHPASGQEKPSGPRSQGTGNQQPGGAMPPMAALEAKQRARGLAAEARALQGNNRLIEARARAQEGLRFEIEATKGGAAFDRNEDTPSQALLDLNTRCTAHIETLLRRAEDSMAGAANRDPSAFQKAAACLAEARQLALVFRLDTARIDERMARLQQTYQLAQGKAPAPTPTPNIVQAGGVAVPLPGMAADPRAVGLDMLEKARLELKNGALNAARHLAEQVFLGHYGVEDEARCFLNSIDAEENNQRHLATCRKFDEAHEAFMQHDYNLARTILAGGVDERLLSPDRLQRLREISAVKEMQPAQAAALPGRAVQQVGGIEQLPGRAVQQVGGVEQQPGRASAGDRRPLTAAPGGLPDDGNFAERFQAIEKITFDKYRVEGLEEQRRAMASARANDYDTAIDILRSYAVRLDGSNLPGDRVAMLRRPVEKRIDDYRKLKAQAEWESKMDSARFPMKDNEKKRTAELRKQQDEMGNLMSQYTALIHEGKYDAALTMAYKMKELDPDSPTVTMAIEMGKIRRNLRNFNANKAEQEDYIVNSLNDAEKTGPYLDMHNPIGWDPVISERAMKRKGVEAGFYRDRRGDVERRIEQRLLAHIDLNWKDTPLKQVVEDLHQIAQVNVVADTDALQEAGVSMDLALSLKVEDMSLKSALNILLKQARLTYVIKDEALQITTEEHAKGKLKMVTYPVGDLVVPVPNHEMPDVLDFFKVAARHMNSYPNWNFGGPMPYIGSGALPAAPPVSNPNSGRGLAANGGAGSAPLGPDKPDKTIEDVLIRLITQTIEPNTWTEVGGKGTIQYFPLGLALVINQTQDIQEQIQDLLQALRRLQDLEVAIEMRLVSVSESFFELMRLDFDLNIMNRQSRYEPQLVTQQFAPPGYLNVFQPSTFFSGLTPAGTFTPDLGVPIKNSSFDFALPPFGGYPGTFGADGGLTLGLAFLSDIQVFMLLEAAQGDRRYNVMQAPKITVFNGQTALITVSDAQFFLTQVNVIPFGSQLVFQPQNSPIFFNITMVVTPVVSADRRFVRMNLAPTLNNLFSANVPLVPIQIPVNTLFNDNITSAQPTIFQTFYQQPGVGTISLNTTVVIPDGGTVLLGGLKALSEGRNEFGPPILSKIPYLNRLFKNVGYGRETQSLMILVTARIIINEEEEQIYLGNLPPIPR
jgi:type II secretory pathway component GspD/PulD (secretin)